MFNLDAFAAAGPNPVQEVNTLLAREISAVETYNQAIHRIEDHDLKAELQACQINHARRAQMLRQQVLDMGGSPVESSRLWGAFVKLIAGGATILGERVAVSILEEGEQHGLDHYRRLAEAVDGDVETIVRQVLLPEQQQTYRTMSGIKKRYTH